MPRKATWKVLSRANDEGARVRFFAGVFDEAFTDIEARRLTEKTEADGDGMLLPQPGDHVAVEEQPQPDDYDDYENLAEYAEPALIAIEGWTHLAGVDFLHGLPFPGPGGRGVA